MKKKFQCRLTSVLSTLSEAAATKVMVLIQGGTKAVDESHRPEARRGTATGAVCAPSPLPTYGAKRLYQNAHANRFHDFH